VAFNELDRPPLSVAEPNNRTLDLELALEDPLLGLKGSQEEHEPGRKA
jgi:hypothetical protein